jgi:plastocyanin
MPKTLAVGDRVSWATSQGRTHGVVEERRTTAFEFDGQRFTASDDEPSFIVRSEKTGARAAHKGSALRRLAAR